MPIRNWPTARKPSPRVSPQMHPQEVSALNKHHARRELQRDEAASSSPPLGAAAQLLSVERQRLRG